MKDENFGLNLPVPKLQLEPATLRAIDESKVKKIIAPFVIRARQMQAQKIGVVCWDSEETARETARLLVAALSQQLDRRCALIVAEGIRFGCENHDCYSLVTLPELDNPNLSDEAADFLHDMSRNFPFQVLAGPTLSEWDRTSAPRRKMLLKTDAQILVMPQTGMTRDTAMKVNDFAKNKGLTWLGVISLSRGGKGTGHA